MNAETYEKLSVPLRRHPSGARVLLLANKALTYTCYVIYPLLIVWQFFSGEGSWLRTLLGPMIAFVLVSVFRDRLNAPRPYEVLDIDPLIKKDTAGHSFPSRHTFSIFAIAMAFLAWRAPVGAVMLVLACCLGAIRVVGGVHFPRDVVAGALMGIASGLIAFWLIP